MYQHLLVPVDGNELSDRAMDSSIALAAKLGATITGFVAELEDTLPAMGRHPSVILREMEHAEAAAAAHANQVLQAFAERAAQAGVRFEGRHVRTTSVDEAIVHAAEDSGSDLIVMVTHGRGAFGELLFGSHTKSVMSRCRLPLLVLH